MVDLLTNPANGLITNVVPRFSWIFRDKRSTAYSQAWQILVASTAETLFEDKGDVWDSGVPSIEDTWKLDSRSVMVPYGGAPLRPWTTYFWKARTWSGPGDPSPWSESQTFRTGELSNEYPRDCQNLVVAEVKPVAIIPYGRGHFFADFGRAAFGTVALEMDTSDEHTVKVHLGEVLAGPGRIHRSPGGSRRYRECALEVQPGKPRHTVVIPPDKRNTGEYAIPMPDDLFEVYPFRYCEVTGMRAGLGRDKIRQRVIHYPFDEKAAQFRSSSKTLNDVWELCKYTIKATSFCGYYVDGDRERIPYEADAYINQLAHYCTDREYGMARRTHEYLIKHPTWPTEWILHSVFMAWDDYMYTGDDSSLRHHYEDLKAKTLIDLADERGLIATANMTDSLLERIHYSGRAQKQFGNKPITNIVDWPQSERDGFDDKPVNAVVNALHYRAVVLFARIAEALGEHDDARLFGSRARLIEKTFASVFIDAQTGLVVDGEGSSHSSLHANMFALAAGLVPHRSRPEVCAHVRSKGMACSVYGAQFLMEALYRSGCADHALALLTSRGERSWAHMIYDVGTTMTLEAWDDRFKPNQDWNHAWGAAPANIIPRYLMGIRPLKPGFEEILIHPQPGGLEWAEITTPSLRGPIHVSFNNHANGPFVLNVETPGNTTARLRLPAKTGKANRVFVNGARAYAVPGDGCLKIDDLGNGRHSIVVDG